MRADFVLYEDIDADALNSLFRHDAPSRTTVTFGTDGVKVELWGWWGRDSRHGPISRISGRGWSRTGSGGCVG
ncbi:HalOD1 output domain-containing protein [Saliphagus sp. GCM10025308]